MPMFLSEPIPEIDLLLEDTWSPARALATEHP
jgi:hypothetical protein